MELKAKEKTIAALEQAKADQDATHQDKIKGIEFTKREMEQQLEQTEERYSKLQVLN